MPSWIIPIVAIIIWITLRWVGRLSFGTIFETFINEKIGSHMIQPRAKATDVVAGAILAPLAAAGFSFVLFNSASV